LSRQPVACAWPDGLVTDHVLITGSKSTARFVGAAEFLGVFRATVSQTMPPSSDSQSRGVGEHLNIVSRLQSEHRYAQASQALPVANWLPYDGYVESTGLGVAQFRPVIAMSCSSPLKGTFERLAWARSTVTRRRCRRLSRHAGLRSSPPTSRPVTDCALLLSLSLRTTG